MLFTFIIIFILAILAEVIHRRQLYQLIAGFHLISPDIRVKLNWHAFSKLLRNTMRLILILLLTGWFVAATFGAMLYVEMISLMVIYTGLITILVKAPGKLTKDRELSPHERQKFRPVLQLNRLGLIILFLNFILILIIFFTHL